MSAGKLKLKGKSKAELVAVMALAQAELENLAEQEKEDCRKEILAVLEKYGFEEDDLVSLFDLSAAQIKTQERIYKYIVDGKPWTGQGKKPQYVLDVLSTGVTLKDIQTKKKYRNPEHFSFAQDFGSE